MLIPFCDESNRYTLNIWDVGGQRTIRSYWRNYFEQTDGLVWVVDSSDLRRLDDCKMELDNLLKEEVGAILLLCYGNHSLLSFIGSSSQSSSLFSTSISFSYVIQLFFCSC